RRGARHRRHHRRRRHLADDPGAARLRRAHPDGDAALRRAGPLGSAGVIVAFARSLVAAAVVSGTPLLYATLAEVLGQRAGVVNLGLEGVMLMGAVVGFVQAVHTGSAAAGVLAAALAGAAFNALFAWFVIDRRANPLATGLALMFAGVGLSALIGTRYIGRPIE